MPSTCNNHHWSTLLRCRIMFTIVLYCPGLHISEDVTRRAKDSRTELRRFTRELKLNDPQAVINMEYDNLKVNGKRYTWSDAIHAVIDTQDNKVRRMMMMMMTMMMVW